MPSNRIVYRDWIVQLGRDPALPVTGTGDRKSQQMIEEAVERALKTLTEDEREFIQRFYNMGQTYRQIAESTNRAQYRLEALHRRAIKRLRKQLLPLVKELYGLNEEIPADCILCRSEHREEIDRVIAERDRTGTWRPVIREIRERFGLKISTPQILIGHEKYHAGR